MTIIQILIDLRASSVNTHLYNLLIQYSVSPLIIKSRYEAKVHAVLLSSTHSYIRVPGTVQNNTYI
jgi:hypothetical protein